MGYPKTQHKIDYQYIIIVLGLSRVHIMYICVNIYLGISFIA